MRDIRHGICPSCDHDEIVEAIPLDFTAVGQKPLAVTHDRRTFFAIGGFDQAVPHGPLRVYVCRRCGLTQWYADKPDEIPIGREHLTRLIKGDRGGPFR